MCMSNNGLSDKMKTKTENNGQHKTKRFLSKIPLLLIHETISINQKIATSKKKYRP